jgi:hypothetical protein
MVAARRVQPPQNNYAHAAQTSRMLYLLTAREMLLWRNATSTQVRSQHAQSSNSLRPCSALLLHCLASGMAAALPA